MPSLLLKGFIYLYVFLYQVYMMAIKLLRVFLLSLAWSIDIFNRARHSQYENEAKRYRHIELRERLQSILKEVFNIRDSPRFSESTGKLLNGFKNRSKHLFVY